ncbi:stigma-specific Stig1 family protein [Carex rostrata]
MFLVLFFLMTIVMPTFIVTPNPLTDKEKEKLVPNTDTLASSESLRGFDYLLRGTATCDKFPRVCRAKGTAGPDCCKKKCVNVMKDNLNCGECGKRCRFGQTCCNGNCIDVMYDERNCGACKNKCKKGSFCNYGMCSYA